MLLNLSDLKDLLKRSHTDDAKVTSLLTIRRGQLEGECEFADGRKIPVAVKFEVQSDEGQVKIELISDIPEATEALSKSEIPLIVDQARARARAYGIRYGSEKQLGALEEWLYARLYEGKLDNPPKQFFKLNEYMEGARVTDELAMSALPIAAMSGYGKQLHLPAIALTLAYCWETEKELERDELVRATHRVRWVQRWSSDGYLVENPNAVTEERAVKAAKARSDQHYSWLKLRICDELTNAPRGSWKNMSGAKRYLMEKIEIWRFYEANREKSQAPNGAYLNWDNFEATLYKWIREDKMMRKIVDSAKSEK